MNLETDQVLVFRREADGARTAHPVDAEGLQEYVRDYMLGELWMNFGEEGLLRPQDRLPELPGTAVHTPTDQPAEPIEAAA